MHGSRVSLHGQKVKLHGPRVSLQSPRASMKGSKVSIQGSRWACKAPRWAYPAPEWASMAPGWASTGPGLASKPLSCLMGESSGKESVCCTRGREFKECAGLDASGREWKRRIFGQGIIANPAPGPLQHYEYCQDHKEGHHTAWPCPRRPFEITGDLTWRR